MKPTRQPGRPGPSPRFTREYVLEKALELIEAAPPEEFSMRRLGEALGVRSMTLYGYVDNKNDIIESVTRLALDKFHQEPNPDASWSEQLRAMLREIHLVCREYSHLASLVISRDTHIPGLLHLRERMLALLRGAGFDDTTALHALGVLAYYTTGFSGGQAFQSMSDAGSTVAQLPHATFPQLTSLAGSYEKHASEEAFEFGLELLLDGLRRKLS
ncbi:MAG TPA: TetR/AcrR family transcriptional regulator C-terminal domain-containing protein [Pseudonocardia sp.]